MRLAGALAWGVLAASAFGGEPTASHRWNCAEAEHELLVPSAGGVTIQSVAAQTLWVEVRETGHRLSVAGKRPDASMDIPVPWRFGLHRVRLEPSESMRVKRAATSFQDSVAHTRVFCASFAVDATRERWLREASSIANRLRTFLSTDDTISVLESIDRLRTAAISEFDSALAFHLKAQALLMGGRSADAADAFAAASALWLRVGDFKRARVAVVGHVEELLRLARHADVLPLVDAIPGALADRDYFAARLKLSGCLALRYLGRMREALTCFSAGVARMERMGEQLDLVSAIQDMADVSRFLGDSKTARSLGERALRASTLPQMEVHRGRIALMLAELASEEGDIAQTLSRLDDALVEFAAAKAVRWEASALLSSADLYIELGALDEAADLVDGALRRLSERDAPARVAAARVRSAHIDMRAGRTEEARLTLENAATTFARLKMPAELDSVQSLRARLLLQTEDVGAAASAIAARDAQQTLNTNDWVLLEAEVALASGSCAVARLALARLDGIVLPLGNEVRRVEVLARCLAADGDGESAQQLLRASATKLGGIVRSVQSPLLRQMLTPHIDPLRSTAFALQGVDANSSEAMEKAWQWVQIENVAWSARRSADPAADSEQFDAHVAKELLGSSDGAGGSESRGGTRSLLSLLASQDEITGAVDTRLEPVSLQVMQGRLAPGVVFLSYVRAGNRSRLLWVTADDAGLIAAADSEAWTKAARELTALLSDSETPLHILIARAQLLSTTVLPVDLPTLPERLLVDAGTDMASLPWAVLRWPGSDRLLIETTQVTLAHTGSERLTSRAGLADVVAFVATPDVTGSQPVLWNAGNEPKLIAGAIKSHGKRVTTAPAADREALIAAFGRPQPWLHVATHGSAATTRMGYAGVWLDDANGSNAPRLVSWLEILARGATAEMVVLNACQLADDSSRWLSFADAVSRAGARHVVAARWQVSDGASTTWVPAFYASLARGDNASKAIWIAQQDLRNSRAYRHPFYWASFVHIENW